MREAYVRERERPPMRYETDETHFLDSAVSLSNGEGYAT